MQGCAHRQSCPHLAYESCAELLAERRRLRHQLAYKDHLIRLATEEISRLRAENRKISEEREYLQAKLNRIHRETFAVCGDSTDDQKVSAQGVGLSKRPRGAPKGHRGATRKKPDHVDRLVEVYTTSCPLCGQGNLSPASEISEHTQEDTLIPLVVVTRFRHHHAYCPRCKKVVCASADEELACAYIGPVARAIGGFLRYGVKLSYGTVRKIMKGLLGMDVSESALLGFDKRLCQKGLPLYEALKEKLRFSEVVHIDETGWRKGAQGMWLWCLTNPGLALYHIDSSRGSKVVTGILGEEYGGTIVSDFFSAYHPLKAKGKAKCAAHLTRTAKELKEDLPNDPQVQRFCAQLLNTMSAALEAHKEFLAGKMDRAVLRCKKQEASQGLIDLSRAAQENRQAENLRKRISRHHDEILAFLENPQVEPTNNRVERQLRPNVIMRKLTFGNRSEGGTRNHSVIMSLVETAKLNRQEPREFLLHLIKKGPGKEAVEMMLGNAQSRAP
jgi:transposase